MTKDPHDRRRPPELLSQTSDEQTGEDKRSTLSERRAALRRKLDKDMYEMASEALKMSAAAVRSIDQHVIECQQNYQHMTFILKVLIAVVGTGTLLLLTGIGAVAWAMLEFVLNNPHLLGGK